MLSSGYRGRSVLKGETVAHWHSHSHSTRRDRSGNRVAIPERPSSAGAIIRWFLANGYTMSQIRVMFPGLFL